MANLQEKYAGLKDSLKRMGKVAVAFSAGVDSTFLLKVAYDVLGKNVLAITSKTNAIADCEINEAKKFCEELGVKHFVVKIDESEIENFYSNPKNRCYFCKKILFKKMEEVAFKWGAKYILEGSNFDDLKDFRPGFKAIQELNVKSPLLDFEFTKKEIRELSLELNLKTAEKPSFACLASRIPYGEFITPKKLLMIEKSEKFLMELGFKQFRVRLHEGAGNIFMARIELPLEDLQKAIDFREQICEALKPFGFKFISLDLQGFKSGNLN